MIEVASCEQLVASLFALGLRPRVGCPFRLVGGFSPTNLVLAF